MQQAELINNFINFKGKQLRTLLYKYIGAGETRIKMQKIFPTQTHRI